MRRHLVLFALAAAGALICVQFASADTTVGPLAGTGTDTSNVRSASSPCPTGAIVTGLQVGQESSDYVGSVAVICTSPDGTVTTASAIGDNGPSQHTISCGGTDGLGIYGYTGFIVNGVGLRCGEPGGAATNGPLVTGGGGSPNGPYDCPVGWALTGLTGLYAFYSAGATHDDVVSSLTGVCSEVLSGTIFGPLTISPGQSVILSPDTTILGPVTVGAGAVLAGQGATIAGPLSSSAATTIRLCGSTVYGTMNIAGTTGLVVIGDDDGAIACSGNTIAGSASITGGTGGVEFDGNTVFGPLTITGNTGTLAPPDTGTVDATANTVDGPSTVQ